MALARADAVVTVQAGDILDGDYRVEAVEPDCVTLAYPPLDTRETLAIA